MNHCEGHGSAKLYSSSNDILSTSPLTFMIVNSNFKHSEGAKSVVYKLYFDHYSYPSQLNHVNICIYKI